MEKFVEWEMRFAPVFEEFLAALHQCGTTAERRWAPALVANADQLRAASRSLGAWSTEHPSPDRNFDVLLARVARSTVYAARTLESVAVGSSNTWLVVDRELNGLRKMAARVTAMLCEN